MNFHEDASRSVAPITISNLLPSSINEDEAIMPIIEGLSSDHKRISSRYFYDAVGSQLFEEITLLPEYYLTRTEKNILKDVSPQIVRKLVDIDIIEIGSGDSSKISLLLESLPAERMEAIRYIPVDVNQAAIENAAKSLIKNFPGLKIHGVVGDFEKQLNRIPKGKKRLICFFGSTIGNLSREDSMKFMAELGRIMPSDGMLLLGVDMVKDIDVLENAYKDSKKITEKFNRNILNVINNLVGTDFVPDFFEHIAFYNEEHSRIEMHLRAMERMEISTPYLKGKIIIQKGETIHTENSYKFTHKHIDDLTRAGGMDVKNIFTDENKWFSLIQFCKRA
ncbi:MAG: L-histidine N(alpha)-methyltransferase [Candidatus Aminicenantes bacterium]|nr:MAG: L-histidine N(alpha)-methyltransferase [Candidatus Aminicenantes bacterium]